MASSLVSQGSEGVGGFRVVQKLKGTLEGPNSFILLFHHPLCIGFSFRYLSAQSPKLASKTSDIMFSHWHPSKEERAEAQLLSLLDSLFIQEGKHSVDFPLDLTGRTGSLVYL